MAEQIKKSIDPGALAQVTRTLRLVWRLMNDPRVPVMPKLIVLGTIIYVVSPIDVVPDVIPILGQADDLAVIVFGIRFFIAMCPPDIVMEHRRAIEGDAASPAHDDYVDATYRVVEDK